MLTLVAAMAHDRVIGHDGKMPWHLPHEFKHFKAVTIGKPVIMGRTTYELTAVITTTRQYHYQSTAGFTGAGAVYHSIRTHSQSRNKLMRS